MNYANGQHFYLGLGGGYEGSLTAKSVTGFIEFKTTNSLFSLCYDPAVLINEEQTVRSSQFYLKINMKSSQRFCPLVGMIIRDNEVKGWMLGSNIEVENKTGFIFSLQAAMLNGLGYDQKLSPGGAPYELPNEQKFAWINFGVKKLVRFNKSQKANP